MANQSTTQERKVEEVAVITDEDLVPLELFD